MMFSAEIADDEGEVLDCIQCNTYSEAMNYANRMLDSLGSSETFNDGVNRAVLWMNGCIEIRVRGKGCVTIFEYRG